MGHLLREYNLKDIRLLYCYRRQYLVGKIFFTRPVQFKILSKKDSFLGKTITFDLISPRIRTITQWRSPPAAVLHVVQRC